MKLQIDETTIETPTEGDLVRRLRECDSSAEEFCLESSVKGLSIYATCSSEEKGCCRYAIFYRDDKEKWKEFFAVPKRNESPDIEWVIQVFRSFYNETENWRNDWEWNVMHLVDNSPKANLRRLLLVLFLLCVVLPLIVVVGAKILE